MAAVPPENKFYNTVKERNLKNAVDLPGWTDDPMEYFEDVSIYVLTSDRDMLLISLLEAGYWGAIPVYSSIGAIPDIVDDDVNGFLVELGRTKEYVDQISREAAVQMRERIISSR